MPAYQPGANHVPNQAEEIPRELQKFAAPQLRSFTVGPLPQWPKNHGAGPHNAGQQPGMEPHDRNYVDLASPLYYPDQGLQAPVTNKRKVHLWMACLTLAPLVGSIAFAGVLVALEIETDPYVMLIGLVAVLGLASALVWVSIAVVAGVERLLQRQQGRGGAGQVWNDSTGE